MAVRLIALDIDGTLLDSQWRVPECNIRAITDATARGMEIVLVTGRRFDFAKPVADQIPCDFTMIVNNGALTRTRDGITHDRRPLPAETARQVLAATRDFRDGAAVIFDRPSARQVIYESVDFNNPARRRYFERNREFIAVVVPLEKCLEECPGEDPIQVSFTGGVERMRAAVALLRALSSTLPFELAFTEYPERDFTIVDVLAPGCTKGRALADWTAHRGLDRSEVMAIGDNWNDREMLEFAGVPIVMGNSAEELKSLGWRVTLSNDECGVAAAIRGFAFDEVTELS
jgi:hydroxymethylpyrimidine pyrophosphatase-like HAD family hydrolase